VSFGWSRSYGWSRTDPFYGEKKPGYICNARGLPALWVTMTMVYWLFSWKMRSRSSRWRQGRAGAGRPSGEPRVGREGRASTCAVAAAGEGGPDFFFNHLDLFQRERRLSRASDRLVGTRRLRKPLKFLGRWRRYRRSKLVGKGWDAGRPCDRRRISRGTHPCSMSTSPILTMRGAGDGVGRECGEATHERGFAADGGTDQRGGVVRGDVQVSPAACGFVPYTRSKSLNIECKNTTSFPPEYAAVGKDANERDGYHGS